MKVLVVGNLGYVGPLVVQHMSQAIRGVDVVGFDIGFFSACLLNCDVVPEVDLRQQHYGDVRYFDKEAVAGFDAVVMLAAISNDPMGKSYEPATYEINYEAAIKIANFAKEAGVKSFVYASSCSVYGAAGDLPRTEQAELNPQTAYAKSKIMAEAALKKVAAPGFTVTCLRFATACGFSPRLRLDLVFNDFVASACASGRIDILSNGMPWRPLIHVKDMARAIEWACQRKPAEGDLFLAVNVGSDQWNYRIKDLASAIADVIGDIEVRINPSASPDSRSYQVDFGLFRQLAPHHQPSISLREAVEELVAEFKYAGFTDTNFRGSNFVRLNHLNALRQSGRLSDRLTWV